MTELLFGITPLYHLLAPKHHSASALGLLLLVFCLYRLAVYDLKKASSEKEMTS